MANSADPDQLAYPGSAGSGLSFEQLGPVVK